MAGAGYKLFNTGDVLTAAQVNTYLQEQAVMVFADAAARTTALSGVVAEGMISYLKDTDVVQYYTGSTWTTINTDQTPLTTKGDLFTYTTTDARLASSGVNGDILTVDTSTASGLKWAAPASSGGMTLLSTTSLSGASTTISSISGSYNNLQINFENVYAATDGTQLYMRINSDTGNNYAWYTFSTADGGLNTGTTGQWQLSKVRNGSTTGSGTVMLWNYASTVDKAASWSFNYSDTNVIGGWGAYSTTSAISSITFLMATGNISGGTVKIYGVK